MAQVQNLSKVVQYLKAKEKGARIKYRVTVGYTQEYAIYVHENLEANFKVGQAKYLEQPARELQGQMAQMVKDYVAGGMKLGMALYMVGLFLQRESQKLCPVDTGALRASAFTRLEEKET